MRIQARDAVAGDVLHLNGWQLHAIRIEHDKAVAVLTAEFGFLIHFAQDDVVPVEACAAA
jgi:hypothetical protein